MVSTSESPIGAPTKPIACATGVASGIFKPPPLDIGFAIPIIVAPPISTLIVRVLMSSNLGLLGDLKE